MVTQGSNDLEANLVSYTLVKENEKSVLRANLARINPQLADLKASKEATIIFQEPQGLHHALMVSDKERAQEGSPNLELHNRKSLGELPGLSRMPPGYAPGLIN